MRLFLATRPYALLLLAVMASVALLFPEARSKPLGHAIGLMNVIVPLFTFARLRQLGVLGMTLGQVHRSRPPGLQHLLLDVAVSTMGLLAASEMR